MSARGRREVSSIQARGNRKAAAAMMTIGKMAAVLPLLCFRPLMASLAPSPAPQPRWAVSGRRMRLNTQEMARIRTAVMKDTWADRLICQYSKARDQAR